MLTLGRESGEYVVIADKIVIQVVKVGNQIRLAIDAPCEMTIERGENYELKHGVPKCIIRLRAKTDSPKQYGFSRFSEKAPAEKRTK